VVALRYAKTKNLSRCSGHNRLFLSPSVADKSMLVMRLTTILPAMTLAEAIETTRMHAAPTIVGGAYQADG
jgi:magnesium chelatase family protein